MGIESGAYKFVLLLHLISVIVGFGSMVLNGVYAAEAKRLGPAAGLSIFEANEKVVKIAEFVIYSVPIWGIGLVMMSDDAWSFSSLWIALSLLLYIGALGLSHGVMTPTVKRISTLMAEINAGSFSGPPPQAAEMESLGKRAGMVGGILNLTLVVILTLMVFKPGA